MDIQNRAIGVTSIVSHIVCIFPAENRHTVMSNQKLHLELAHAQTGPIYHACADGIFQSSPRARAHADRTSREFFRPVVAKP